MGTPVYAGAGCYRANFRHERPLEGLVIGMALHVEAKTANLAAALASAGARVYITGCNPLSTQDDVALALNSFEGVECYAKRRADEGEPGRAAARLHLRDRLSDSQAHLALSCSGSTGERCP